jgi:hypothetical protein
VNGTVQNSQSIIADETHSSPIFAVVLGLPAIAFAFVIAKVPMAGLQAVLGMGLLLLLAGSAMAFSGFHYVFTPGGVEVRTLGFRLRSIPAYAIESYSADNWSGLGGYGIRGVGDRRAYMGKSWRTDSDRRRPGFSRARLPGKDRA